MVRKKKEHDFSVTAFRVVQEATGQPKFNAVELGRKGGLKGGRARAEKLTPEQRSEIARKAISDYAKKLALMEAMLDDSELTEKDVMKLDKKLKKGIHKHYMELLRNETSN